MLAASRGSDDKQFAAMWAKVPESNAAERMEKAQWPAGSTRLTK